VLIGGQGDGAAGQQGKEEFDHGVKG